MQEAANGFGFAESSIEEKKSWGARSSKRVQEAAEKKGWGARSSKRVRLRRKQQRRKAGVQEAANGFGFAESSREEKLGCKKQQTGVRGNLCIAPLCMAKLGVTRRGAQQRRKAGVAKSCPSHSFATLA